MKKLLSVSEAESLDIKTIKNFYSKYLNANQEKILSKFSYGSDIFVSAEGMYMNTKDGKKILDFSGGIGVLNHGHNNNEILNTRIEFQKNKRVEIHKTIFSPYTASLAHNISLILPKNLCKSFFCNSGAESVEGAVKAAYKYHEGKRKYILHSDIAFHGKLIASSSLSDTQSKKIFPELLHKKVFKYNDKNSLERLINETKNRNGSDIYAIIIETYSNSTLTEASEDFVRYLRKITEKHKIILIFDEVYTGWGKTGELFHFNHYKNLSPDILCFSKSFGGGKSSISTYVVNKNIYKKIYENNSDAFLHTSTYNGFGEECATAITAINEIFSNNLIKKSNENGAYIKLKLNELKSLFPNEILDIRGKGSLNGIILSSLVVDIPQNIISKFPFLNKNAKILAKIPAAALSDFLYSKHKIFTVITENDNEVIFNVSPSLIVNKNEIDWFFDCLKNSFNYGLNKLVIKFLGNALVK